MKYMEIPELAALSRSLQHHSAECTVHTRIEAYSCKSINRDKKLFAALEHAYAHDVPDPAPSAFGSLAAPAARKTLYLLIATLNVAFPDHSFAAVRPDAFVREPGPAHILHALSTTLLSPRPRPDALGHSPPRTYAAYPPPPDPPADPRHPAAPFFPSSVPTSSSPPNPFANSAAAPPPLVAGTHPALYKLLDDVICLPECEVFSFSPDPNADPHAVDSDDPAAPESDEDSPFSDADSDADAADDDDDNGAPFVFDADSDDPAAPTSASPPKSRWIHDPVPPRPRPASRARPRARTHTGASPTLSPAPAVATRARPRAPPPRRHPRTPLLWSSHWFFYNRRLRRILFVAVWARKRAWPAGDVFRGWAGDVGAGARAMGLVPRLARSV